MTGLQTWNVHLGTNTADTDRTCAERKQAEPTARQFMHMLCLSVLAKIILIGVMTPRDIQLWQTGDNEEQTAVGDSHICKTPR